MIAHGRPALQVVVLAAGYSARLGEPKALAAVHGISLLQRTLQVLSACLPGSNFIVIVPPRSGRYQLGLDKRRTKLVVNHRRAAGLSSSVRLGIRHSRYASAVLLLPVDLVGLQSRDLARLIRRWRAGGRKVVARRVPQGPATPLILPRAYFSRALGLTGDQGLRDLMRGLTAASARLVTLPSADADVDTPGDLRRARRNFNATSFGNCEKRR